MDVCYTGTYTHVTVPRRRKEQLNRERIKYLGPHSMDQELVKHTAKELRGKSKQMQTSLFNYS